MKKIIGIIVGVIVIGGLSFYGGMKYAGTARGSGVRQAFANLSPEERQARFRDLGGPGFVTGRIRGGEMGGAFVAGEILSKDDKSLTIKLRDGGSKIVFFTETTGVTKSVSGSAADLVVGGQVTVTGKTNQDGSLSAESIQIRPNTSTN